MSEHVVDVTVPTSHFDHLDPATTAADALAAYADMQEQCPVVHNPKYGGYYMVTRYDEVRAMLSAPEGYSCADGPFTPSSGLPPIAALFHDGEEHRWWRSVLERPLTPQAVRAFVPALTELVHGLIDGFAERGTVDLIEEFAEPLPAIAIAGLVGLDARGAVEVREITSELFAAIGTPEFTTRFDAFAEYTEALLESRRQEPREDLLTDLARGEVDGRLLTSAEVAGVLIAYLLGGHHSTASALGSLLHRLVADPELARVVVAEPRTLTRTVEETLRIATPLHAFGRTTTCPVDIAGVSMDKGTRVVANLAAANRDPREFEDPERFDPTRKRNRHVTFGAGAHVCVGQHLARAEMTTAARVLLERLPDLHLDGEVTTSGLQGGNLVALTSLPVAFSPQPVGTRQ